jgi:pectin methylesterase-like acyl-CoA thioesterase
MHIFDDSCSCVQNTFGTTAPAVATRVAGDRAAFYGCRFLSFQDTLLDDTERHYYRGCYVEGDTDFIFGNGQALFDVSLNESMRSFSSIDQVAGPHGHVPLTISSILQ